MQDKYLRLRQNQRKGVKSQEVQQAKRITGDHLGWAPCKSPFGRRDLGSFLRKGRKLNGALGANPSIRAPCLLSGRKKEDGPALGPPGWEGERESSWQECSRKEQTPFTRWGRQRTQKDGNHHIFHPKGETDRSGHGG